MVYRLLTKTTSPATPSKISPAKLYVATNYSTQEREQLRGKVKMKVSTNKTKEEEAEMKKRGLTN